MFTEALSVILRRANGEEGISSCATTNEYNGNMGLRISAVFVILVTSSFGALFPVVAKNNPSIGVPSWSFFFAKYFGSGIIVATAFIHLLTPANEALTNPCLTGPITEYPWAQGIALMSVFVLFFVELLAMRHPTFNTLFAVAEKEVASSSASSSSNRGPNPTREIDAESNHTHPVESYAAQLTSIFILEFGIVFHSIFIGLTLAVSGEEFKMLYIVFVFHQMFEGLGLGARLATVPWPASKKLTPYLMALGFGLSTPIAAAVGLGVRNSYSSEGEMTLVINGVFDAISAGILLYTGLVELMAHEFLFSQSLRGEKTSVVFAAFGWMVLGAGLMALLGKWA